MSAASAVAASDQLRALIALSNCDVLAVAHAPPTSVTKPVQATMNVRVIREPTITRLPTDCWKVEMLALWLLATHEMRPEEGR